MPCKLLQLGSLKMLISHGIGNKFCTLKIVRHHSRAIKSNQVFNLIFKRQWFHSGNCLHVMIPDENVGLKGDLEIDKPTIQYNEDDVVIKELLGGSSVNDVFEVMARIPRYNLTKEHVAQAVFTIYHLMQSYRKVQTELGGIDSETKNSFISRLHALEPFHSLLATLKGKLHEYNPEELSALLLHLSVLKVDGKSDIMQAIISLLENRLTCTKTLPSLKELSQFCVSLRNNNELRTQFLRLKVIPRIEEKLDFVNNAEDLRLITICVMHTSHLLSIRTLTRYRDLCDRIVHQCILTPEDCKIVVNVMAALSIPQRLAENLDTLRKVSKRLHGNVKKLPVRDMVVLSKILHSAMEPAALAEEISATCRDLMTSPMSEKDEHSGILSCVAELGTHSDRVYVEKAMMKEVSRPNFTSNASNLFHTLRCLKTANWKLCNIFWSKACDMLNRNDLDSENLNFLQFCFRYMYFNNNMGGTYRYYGFENSMFRQILEDIEHGQSAYTPSKLVKGVSFIIAYCKDEHILRSSIDRVLAMREQLSKVDCVFLSRGMEIMMELTKRHNNISPETMQKLAELDTCLNDRAWVHVNDEKLNMAGLNAIVRALSNRRGSPDTLLFHTLIKRLNSCNDPLSSRLIRDLSFSMTNLSCLLPELMDKKADYVIRNEEYIVAEISERVLTTSYQLGYLPKSGTQFLEACERLLMRDKDRISCLAIIQTCLALSFFHRFSSELSGFVFSVEFLERIDEELATCYSKASYPVRVRYALMELNRCVCLDMPELDIPWFHAKYCEEIAALDPAISSPFHDDVKNHFLKILKNDQYLQCSVYGPYGYKINFLILLDKSTKPLFRLQENTAHEKVAILLHSQHQFTYGLRRLKGQQQIRQRHLEMLGYRVVSIAEQEWNSMYLSETHAKLAFLEKNLWPDR